MNRSRTIRRMVERAAVKEANRGGYNLPEHFACPACGGSCRRWKWLRIFPLWLWTLCRVCAGSGLDPVPARRRLAEAYLAKKAASR